MVKVFRSMLVLATLMVGVLALEESAGAAAPAAPVVSLPTQDGQFHPFEYVRVRYSAPTGAVRYRVESSNFPDRLFSGVDTTASDTAIVFGQTGTWYVRVRAINAAGEVSEPSNTVRIRITYSAPIPAAPALTTPGAGATVAGLPVTLAWADSSTRSQASYWEVQVHTSPNFQSGFGNEGYQLVYGPNQTTATFPALSPGVKYWRVRGIYGDASTTTPARSAWSATRTFALASAAPGVASISLSKQPSFGGDFLSFSSVTLTTPAPTGGAAVTLTSSDPQAMAVPASVTVPAGGTSVPFTPRAGYVTAATAVTITASYAGRSATTSSTVLPASISSATVLPGASVVGGWQPAWAQVVMNGRVPPDAAPFVATSTDATVASPQAITTGVTDSSVVDIPVVVPEVSQPATATIDVTWNGATVSTPITVVPQSAPSGLAPANGTSLTSVLGFSWSQLVGAASYQVELDGLVLGTTTQTVWAVTVASGTHTWRVRAVSSNGLLSPWAAASFIVTGSGGGGTTAPTLSSPANGARFRPGSSVSFSWSAVNGAAGYVLEIDDSTSFAAPLSATRSTTSTSVAVAGLSGRLNWRVRAVGSDGTLGPWSTVRTVEVR